MAEPARPAAGTAPGREADVSYALGGSAGEFRGLVATLLGLLDEAVKSLQEATAIAEKAGALPSHVPCLQAASPALDPGGQP